MGLVTRRNLKARKHHYPMRGQGLAQSIYRRDASMVGDPEYPNIEFQAFLKQCLVVGGFVQLVIGTSVCTMV